MFCTNAHVHSTHLHTWQFSFASCYYLLIYYLIRFLFCSHSSGFIGSIFVKFSQLILMNIIKIVATRCQILMLKCTKLYFGCGSAPDPTGGAYSAPTDPLAEF